MRKAKRGVGLPEPHVPTDPHPALINRACAFQFVLICEKRTVLLEYSGRRELAQQSLRSEVNTELNFHPNFQGLVLGCIDADFCK